MNAQRPSLALVIGSGSVKCAAALGVWKVLQNENIKLDMVVGCSGGSLYAAAIALGYDISTSETMTLSFWTGDLMAGYASNLRAAMSGEMEFTERSGLVDDAPLMKALHQAFGERRFDQTLIPLHLVATDFRSGEKVVLSQGKLVDAIRASVAIPIVWSPWEIDGRLLTDGAAADPLPVDVAIKEGAYIILSLGFDLPHRARLRSFNAVQTHLNSIYINNLLRATYAFYNLAHHAEIIPLWPNFDRNVSTFDTQQFPYIIEQGQRAAEEQLPYLRRLLETAEV
jgi:NTE family protein